MTRKPIWSVSSSSSGAGGLWLMRMALQPISRSISSWRSRRADVERRAQRAEVVMLVDALEGNALAVDEDAESGSKLNVANAEARFVSGPRFFARPARSVVTAT